MRVFGKGSAAALAILALAAPAAAATLSYSGSFSVGGYISGSFAGDDLDGDGQVSQAELTRFHAIIDNLNGGPGQYYAETTEVSDFLFSTVGGLAELTGTVTYWLTASSCGGWGQEPCFEDGGFSRMMARSLSAFSYSYPVQESFRADQVIFAAAAPVPLPAGLPLLAAGAGALALVRRRSQRA